MYIVIATKPVHQLQMCKVVHNYMAPPTILPSYIRVRGVVWEWAKGQTDRYTDGSDQYTFPFSYAWREI